MPLVSFNGPSCKGLIEFLKGIKEMPSEYKATFDSISKTTIETICDPEALHIWESSSDLDGLLQLTQVIIKLRNASASVPHSGQPAKDAAIIIAEEKKGQDSYRRIIDLVRHLTGSGGKEHLNGTVCAFDAIVVVRGPDAFATDDQSAAVKRINTAIERVTKKSSSRMRKLIWHHGPIVVPLLTWINTTKPELRNSLAAITITGTLDLMNGIKPSPLGRPNKIEDMQRLEEYGKELNIAVVFLDPNSQLIFSEYLPTYMYFWAYYVNTFLPSSISRPHLHKALDELITFSFRLRGASEGTYGSSVVRMVQARLDPSKAKAWARTSINSASYTKELCRDAAKDQNIHHAVQLADSPFALLSASPGYPLPAFARLAVCPAAPSSSTNISMSTAKFYIAAPVAIAFSAGLFRAASPSPFRILLPREGQDIKMVTERIQGWMMGVTERVRQERGNPRFSSEEREVWHEVVEACCWALDGCKGKCPEGVEEKLAFVRERLEGGIWARSVGQARGGAQKARGGGWGA